MRDLNRRGVTLLELAIVLVAIGMMSAVALPRFSAAFRQQATVTAVDRFVRAHELARSTAVRFGRVSRLHIDASTGRFWVDVDTSGTGVRDTIGAIRTLADLGVQMTSTDTLTCFDARGIPSTTSAICQMAAATLVFSQAGRAETLTVTTLGKVLR